MPVQTKAEEPPKKKPAAKKPTAPKKVTTSAPRQNPELEAFEDLHTTIIEAVKKEVDYRISVKDDSPDSIYHFTNEIIKKLVRSSKWA
jgi:hypothetical protein